MSRLTWIVAAFAAWSITTASLLAAELGTAAEARAMLERAVAAVKADRAAAIARFNKRDGGFHDRDLYVFCFEGADGRVVSHVDPGQLGKDVRALRDRAGTAFGEMFFRDPKEGAFATVRYMWPRPGQSKPVEKESFVTRIGGLVCGVGYYK